MIDARGKDLASQILACQVRCSGLRGRVDVCRHQIGLGLGGDGVGDVLCSAYSSRGKPRHRSARAQPEIAGYRRRAGIGHRAASQDPETSGGSQGWLCGCDGIELRRDEGQSQNDECAAKHAEPYGAAKPCGYALRAASFRLNSLPLKPRRPCCHRVGGGDGDGWAGRERCSLNRTTPT